MPRHTGQNSCQGVDRDRPVRLWPKHRVRLRLQEGDVAAGLRHAGARAENLEGGFEAWVQGNGLLVRPDHVPPRDNQGRTLWVTRTRPKIDRVACPWLIRRFIDPAAVFLFVAPSEVL